MPNRNLAIFLKALDTEQLLGKDRMLHQAWTIRNYTPSATQSLKIMQNQFF